MPLTKPLIIIGLLGLLLTVDVQYFKNLRTDFDGGRISEGFLNKGVLGELLKKGRFISIDKQ